MTLVSSGDIHLIGSSGAPTRSICFELYGNYTGPRNLTTMAIAAGDSSPYSITEFYGYSACSETSNPSTYATSASWLTTGVIRVFFLKDTADTVDIQYSTNNSTWYDLTTGYTGSSPYSTSTSCSNVYYRARGTNCYGTNSYGSSVYAGSCP
jgi:hypothetical protein